MATASSSRTKPVHLVVLCHGLWGEPKHLHTLATLLCRSFGSNARISKGSGGRRQKKSQIGPEDVDSVNGSDNDSNDSILVDDDPNFEKYIKDHITLRKEDEQSMNVVIVNSMSSAGTKTYDGIDWIAERTVREIKAEQDDMKKRSEYVARFSIIGYSLGGLVARYTVALLDSQGFFQPASGDKIEARQFATFATPHLGIPPAEGSFGKIASYIGGRMLSRTGEQLYVIDSGWETEGDIEHHQQNPKGNKIRVGLLECMSRPGSTFIRALNRFKKVTFYANAVNDITVPFRTGCIEEYDPFLGLPGHVEVHLHEGTPIVSHLEAREVPPQTRWESIRAGLPSVPFFLNPKRSPFKAPYNYLLVLGIPVLLPTFLVLLLYRFQKESRKSRARITELDKGWDLEEGRSDEGSSRIERVLRSVAMSTSEDRVEEDRSFLPSSPTREKNPKIFSRRFSMEPVIPNQRSPLSSLLLKKRVKQSPLLDSQMRMLQSFNDPANVPLLEKKWVYFDDVVNSHAIIICRTPSMSAHRRGLDVLKHFVDDFPA